MQKKNSVIKNYILSSEKYFLDKKKKRRERDFDSIKNSLILYLLFYANMDSCE